MTSITQADVDAAITIALGLQKVAFDSQIAALAATGGGGTATCAASITGGVLKSSDIIGIFNTTSRSNLEIETAALTFISKDEKDNLSASEKAKIQASFVKGVPKELHFNALYFSRKLKEMMSLDNLVSIQKQQSALVSHLTSISTNGTFFILRFAAHTTPGGAPTVIDPDTSAGEPINLLKCLSLPDLVDVINSCDYMAARGSDFIIENLKWTYISIMNSCDKTLRVILQSKMLKYPTSKYRPVLYWFLMKQLTSADDTVVWSIITKMTNIDISSTLGQSITSAVSRIRAAMSWLDRIHMVPNDMVAIIKQIMTTCNVPGFIDFFASLVTNVELNNISLTSESILTLCEEEYGSLVHLGKFDLSTKGMSSFHGGTVPEVTRGSEKSLVETVQVPTILILHGSPPLLWVENPSKGIREPKLSMVRIMQPLAVWTQRPLYQ